MIMLITVKVVLFKVFAVVIECFVWLCSLVQYSLVPLWYLQ